MPSARSRAATSADEPAGNAQILTRLYLEDAGRGCCRRLSPEDLQAQAGLGVAGTRGVRWDAPLVAGIGVFFRLQVLTTEGGGTLRWTEIAGVGGDGPPEHVSLRQVVARLQDYEPALSMTAAGILAQRQQHPGSSLCGLRGELKRVVESPIVLNRRLRERVERLACDFPIDQAAHRNAAE